MGRTERATTTELRAPGELHDHADSRATGTVVIAVAGLLVALAAFFIVFAPGV
jgi:hypothetical protein